MSTAEHAVLLQAFLSPDATEDEVAELFDTCPFVVPPELIHPEGVRLLWQYVQRVDAASISATGLEVHRCRLDALPGITVRWFDAATEVVEMKAIVRVFNLGHFGARRG